MNATSLCLALVALPRAASSPESQILARRAYHRPLKLRPRTQARAINHSWSAACRLRGKGRSHCAWRYVTVRSTAITA